LSKKEKVVKRQPKKKPGTAEKAQPSVREKQTRGPPPLAVVQARHGDGMVERPARGFSMGELGRAEVPYHVARRLGIQLDLRRRSILEGNVSTLKRWYSPPKKVGPERVGAKPRKRAKRTTSAPRRAKA
jgi:ribosomal protein L13E